MKILVTGGSRGIGAEVVRQLGGRRSGVYAPFRSRLDLQDIVSIRKYLTETPADIDTWVFCHGTWYSTPPSMRSIAERPWLDQYRERVSGPMAIIDTYLAFKKDISVVMVSSTRGFIGGVDTGPYAAACAAQIALMQGYAREWPDSRFNVICPGWTDTDMGKEVLATGGANPKAVPQDPAVVAAIIVDLVMDVGFNGAVFRVVDGIANSARWSW